MMEKTDETIPSREELAVFIEEAAVSVTNNYEEAPAVLMVDDAVIGTLGNFSASIGKAKSKKTFNVSAIAASALSGRTVLRYRSMFPENKRKILYIDTEQGRHHCQQVLKRILRLAEMPDDKVPENLIMLSLRKFAPRVRLLIVEEAIGTTPDLGLVIIDGIRDFLYDINSSSKGRKKHQSKGDRNKENQTQPVVNKRFCSRLPLQPNSRERQDNARFPLPSHYLFRYLPEA